MPPLVTELLMDRFQNKIFTFERIEKLSFIADIYSLSEASMSYRDMNFALEADQ